MSIINIKHLISHHFISHWKRELKIFAIMIFCAFFLLRAQDNVLETFVWLAVLYSLVELKSIYAENKGMNYLLLPAQTSEKNASTFIIHQIFYVLLSMAALALAYGINWLIAQKTGLYFWTDYALKCQIFTFSQVVNALLSIWCWQVIFVFGGFYFKRHPGLGILLTFIGIGIITSMLIGICTSIVITHDIHYPHFVTRLFDLTNPSILGSDGIFDNNFTNFPGIFYILSAVHIIFWWLMSFLRLRETEV
ncbi:MAG: hypothetical protein K6F29_01325 [Bacteroidales bacterium]|nr:hypothetical protein [Bacteroidales bacterium]